METGRDVIAVSHAVALPNGAADPIVPLPLGVRVLSIGGKTTPPRSRSGCRGSQIRNRWSGCLNVAHDPQYFHFIGETGVEERERHVTFECSLTNRHSRYHPTDF